MSGQIRNGNSILWLCRFKERSINRTRASRKGSRVQPLYAPCRTVWARGVEKYISGRWSRAPCEGIFGDLWEEQLLGQIKADMQRKWKIIQPQRTQKAVKKTSRLKRGVYRASDNGRQSRPLGQNEDFGHQKIRGRWMSCKNFHLWGKASRALVRRCRTARLPGSSPNPLL